VSSCKSHTLSGDSTAIKAADRQQEGAPMNQAIIATRVARAPHLLIRIRSHQLLARLSVEG